MGARFIGFREPVGFVGFMGFIRFRVYSLGFSQLEHERTPQSYDCAILLLGLCRARNTSTTKTFM